LNDARKSLNKKLKIQPMKRTGRLIKVPLDKITVPDTRIVDIPEAVVAYFDVLGFSRKKSIKDFEITLEDFLAPLAIASTSYPDIRFNVFSDCAFLAAPLEKAKDLLASIRFAFTQWIADGILVRGGIAIGQYIENRSVALKMASKNFSGNIFAGSGVVDSVKIESSGCGALLFTNEKCGEFYRKKFGEPIFTLNNLQFLGWSDDEGILYWFLGISLLRLLKIYDLKDWKEHPAKNHLINNLKYSLNATSSRFLVFLTFAILSLPDISSKARKEAVNLLGIKDPDDFAPYKSHIDQWLKQKEDIGFLRYMANSDSSLP